MRVQGANELEQLSSKVIKTVCKQPSDSAKQGSVSVMKNWDREEEKHRGPLNNNTSSRCWLGPEPQSPQSFWIVDDASLMAVNHFAVTKDGKSFRSDNSQSTADE